MTSFPSRFLMLDNTDGHLKMEEVHLHFVPVSYHYTLVRTPKKKRTLPNALVRVFQLTEAQKYHSVRLLFIDNLCNCSIT